MAHIHTGKDEHDYTFGAYIVKLDKPEPKVLLHMHKKMEMLFPIGGHIELVETPWQAAKREIFEESGYDFNQLKILQPKNSLRALSDVNLHPYPIAISDQDPMPGHFHTDIAFGFTTLEYPKAKPLAGESLDLRWLSHNELISLSEKQIFPNTKAIYLYLLDTCLAEWESLDTSYFKN